MVKKNILKCGGIMMICLAAPMAAGDKPQHRSFVFEDDGTYPNNAELPVIVLPQAFAAAPTVDPATIETVFEQNGWDSAWRNGLFAFHHYHSTVHESLGIYAGWVKARLGGPGGETLTARAGDVLVIPAGVSHKNLGQSADFRVVGAYPRGQSWDMMYGKPGERPQADDAIRNVPLPAADPVFGKTGPLMRLWK